MLQRDNETGIRLHEQVDAEHEVEYVVQGEVDGTVHVAGRGKVQDVGFNGGVKRAGEGTVFRRHPVSGGGGGTSDYLPPWLGLCQVLAVVRQAKLSDLRGIKVGLRLPLRGHGHTFRCGDALDAIAHLHVVVLKVHEDAVRIVVGLGKVDLPVAVRPVEAGDVVDGGQGAVHLKVLVEEGEGEENFVSLATTADGVL